MPRTCLLASLRRTFNATILKKRFFSLCVLNEEALKALASSPEGFQAGFHGPPDSWGGTPVDLFGLVHTGFLPFLLFYEVTIRETSSAKPCSCISTRSIYI